jgi:hypothetical protein
MPQAVEQLPSKLEILSSNSSIGYFKIFSFSFLFWGGGGKGKSHTPVSRFIGGANWLSLALKARVLSNTKNGSYGLSNGVTSFRLSLKESRNIHSAV